MIAASEPLEFVPHGRTVLAKHPERIYGRGGNTSASENSLLYKLTNFGIKDESVLEGGAEEQEWWCVREVYSKTKDDFEEDTPQAPKDTKDDMSDSFQPPSRLKNDFNISIKSELMSGVKKMDTESAGPSRASSANSSSNMSKKFKLDVNQDGPKKDSLSPKTDCHYEEELYVKGCTAVWSKGLVSTPATKLSSPEHRETIACYTIDNPIKHAAFANFHVAINNTMLIDALNSQIDDVKKNIKIEDSTEHLPTKVMPSILLIDNKCLKVYATDGREYMTSIPFQVKKVWPMKYGVLLEKEPTQLMQNSMLPTSFSKLNESQNSTFWKSKTFANMSARLRAESVSGYEPDVPLPTCFSLSHPLDEVSPILMKSPSHGLQYYNDGDLQIIFVNSDPSIILIYDCKLATHSLWRIRKTTRDECLSMCPNVNSTTFFSQSVDFVSPMHTHRNMSSGSPFRRPGTPTRSRVDSPLANVFHQQGLSPHASIGQASSASMIGNTVTQSPPTLPLYPDICLDHIWTDSQILRRDPIETAKDTKTFLHTDLVGHEYLCFMVKINDIYRLQIMRLQKSHSLGQSGKTNLIVGSVSTVLAKDAAVLDHLNMIAVIDETGNIILQSGNYVVGKVHVGGVLARLIDSPYTKRSAFQSPFPRRSSLLPSRAHDSSTFDDSALHLLSPVPHTSASRQEQKETLGLRGIIDACGSRATLVFDTGAMYRISLPELASSRRVQYCIGALKLLPSDVTMQVIIKWYGVRNAPGTQDLTPASEWGMFKSLLHTLLGHDASHGSHDDSEELACKRQRTSSDGTQDDWEYLLTSKLHKTVGASMAAMLNLQIPTDNKRRNSRHKSTKDTERPAQFNSNALLFPYTVQVLYAFHLIYEEIKLNTLMFTDLKPLAAFLYQMAKDLRLDAYVNHYWLDFPTDFNLEYNVEDSQMTDAVIAKLSQPTYFTAEPPNINSYLNSMLQDVDVGYYPYLTGVNEMSKILIEVVSIIGAGRHAGIQTISRRDGLAASTPRRRLPAPRASPAHEAVLALTEYGVTLRDIDNLPPALGLLLLSVCARCKSAPAATWPAAAYSLVMREDLALQAELQATVHNTDEYLETFALEALEKEAVYSMNNSPVDEPPATRGEDFDSVTGMDHLNTKLFSLLYPRDHRTSEVFSLLQSSMPVSIELTQRPEVSDHDFIEEQEKHLFAITIRTMALPIARGMVTLRTLPCTPTETLHIPRLCVSGRGPAPRHSTVTLSAADTSPQCLLWPSFHNGVASGLAVVPLTGSSIDSSWVVYNKPRGTTDMSTEHAGFLMALGINGHLKDLPFMNIYEYLVKCNEMISVGLLLGIAATYKGTMDLQATKMMSIHLEALLPPLHVELDVPHGVLLAALLGLGLLHQGSGHAHLARVLLREIGKPAGAETEGCTEREGYALAGGLALGLVCCGLAAAAPAGAAARLRALMLGAERAHPGVQRDKYKQGSCSVREGPAVNLDVTSPGATLALGLIYQRSGNDAIAGWLAPPTTAYQLDFVRPDLLMLRIISRGLIMWHSIEASEEWIENQVPSTIRPHCFVKPTDENIDYEAMNQAYCNIVAGACFALGLRFAGSGLEEARDAALHYARMLLAVRNKSVAVLAGRATLETCLCVCLLSAGMIMAGLGDVAVLRVCRRLRARVAPPAVPSAAPPLTHGGQMAVHSTIGLLFLGGGRSTLSTSPTAVAALVAAFFPKFPTHSEDNRYHLQAFRHLYALAVEPRLILPRDLSSGKLCYAHIQVVDLEGAIKEMKAPCIIPALETLKEVKINDPRYWPIVFKRDQNWDQLKLFLEYTWCIDVKQRAGCLSYLDDPHGFLTILAQSLTLDRSNLWSVHPSHIQLYTNDDKIKNFLKHYLSKPEEKGICADCLVTKKRKGVKSEAFMPKQCCCRQYSREEMEYVQSISMVTYECLIKDILCALPIWTTFLKIIKTMKTDPSTYHIWQVKLLLSQIENHNKHAISDMTVDDQENNEPLMSSEFTLSIKQKVAEIFDSWESKIAPFLRKYVGMPSSRKFSVCDDELKKILCAFVVYHDLYRNVMKVVDGENDLEILASVCSKKVSVAGAGHLAALRR